MELVGIIFWGIFDHFRGDFIHPLSILQNITTGGGSILGEIRCPLPLDGIQALVHNPLSGGGETSIPPVQGEPISWCQTL